MANKTNNRICVCCSTEYRYCNTCSEDSVKPVWYSIYCSENCKKLFYATSNYYAKTATIEETRVKFDDCDLSYKYKLKPKFIEAINDVYNNETKIETIHNMNTIADTIDESVVISEVEETKEKEVEVIKEEKFGNKNKNKKKIVFE